MNDTTIALLFLLVVLVIAAVSSRGVAVGASLAAFACYNFFFLPPVGTFTIANTDDAIALFALLAVSLIGSHLSHLARRRADEVVAQTRRREESEIARRNAETKSALVASLSHDLKTPLTALTVAAENVGAAGLPDADRREQMAIVRSELERLKRLFDNVIDMASVESRARTAELDWVHAADIVDAARQQVSARLANHPVVVDDAGAERLVLLDPRLTSAALAHVLENAATYSPAGSPIEIGVRVGPDGLTMTVRDHGAGLPPHEVDRVFERFYRGAASRPERFTSGMGLAIARGLLTLQGGGITAANHAAGGAVFTLSVPAGTRAASGAALDVA